ncbi:hypothetical protein V9T40_000800 [Parthenolecanium corni]|uniref:Uncharacterized protein n=1 Tax=Parthenolecanium corni TaxID=536013 RepID=A0AAN9TR40_9HEMI
MLHPPAAAATTPTPLEPIIVVIVALRELCSPTAPFKKKTSSKSTTIKAP